MEKNRKSNTSSAPRPHITKTHSIKVINKTHQEDQLSVSLLLGAQRNSITLQVPQNCNMKILKSMLWFHLKKILTSSEYSQIVGFETIPEDYKKDYQLEQGVGQLNKDITLMCLFKDKARQQEEESLLDYKICRLISVGGFSRVFLLRSKKTGHFCVGKFILKHSANPQLVQNQHLIASSLQNPFICQTSPYLLQTQSFFIIIMQYIPGGQLFQLLKINRWMGQDKARFFMVEVLLALRYLHRHNVVYRDIKPENIMVDAQGHIKVTDFGLAKIVKNRERTHSFCGSLDYMAPEVLQQEGGHSFQVDYYSVGNLLYQILIGFPPFYHPKLTQQQTKYHILHTPISFPQNPSLSSQAISLLTNLLQKQPQKRLGHINGVDDILAHQWFQNVDIARFQAKMVEPPIKVDIRMELATDENEQINMKQWEKYIEKDIRLLQIKANYQIKRKTRIYTHNRYRSLDLQGNTSLNQLKKYSYPISPQEKDHKNKLKSNIELVRSLTHKGSVSDLHKRSEKKFHLNKSINKTMAKLQSLNVSRKHSNLEMEKPKSVFRNSSEGTSSATIKTSFVLKHEKMNKENKGFLRKKRDETKKFAQLRK